ncbi:hypothetical protein B0H14DRAFT_3896043 [Mycena olivaceomarginata]|nr:hypothetical protein B0H14DRAFT_3896043 [Mycena olivaceomarginata]
MSKLSNELDEFLDDSVLPTPTPDTAGHHWQAPETPPEAAYNRARARAPPLRCSCSPVADSEKCRMKARWTLGRLLRFVLLDVGLWDVISSHDPIILCNILARAEVPSSLISPFPFPIRLPTPSILDPARSSSRCCADVPKVGGGGGHAAKAKAKPERYAKRGIMVMAACSARRAATTSSLAVHGSAEGKDVPTRIPFHRPPRAGTRMHPDGGADEGGGTHFMGTRLVIIEMAPTKEFGAERNVDAPSATRPDRPTHARSLGYIDVEHGRRARPPAAPPPLPSTTFILTPVPISTSCPSLGATALRHPPDPTDRSPHPASYSALRRDEPRSVSVRRSEGKREGTRRERASAVTVVKQSGGTKETGADVVVVQILVVRGETETWCGQSHANFRSAYRHLHTSHLHTSSPHLDLTLLPRTPHPAPTPPCRSKVRCGETETSIQDCSTGKHPQPTSDHRCVLPA